MTAAAIKKSAVIEDDLVRQLSIGRWAVGDRLPSASELSRQYGACRSTTEKALTALSKRGLLKGGPGKGHFVIQPHARRRTWTLGFTLTTSSNFNHPVAVQRMGGTQQALLGSPWQLRIIPLYSAKQAMPIPSRKMPDHPVSCSIDIDSLDGIATSKAGNGEEALRKMAREIPVCCSDWFEEGLRLSRIQHDFTQGVAAAAGRLIQLGHRRIATLGRATGLHSHYMNGIYQAECLHRADAPVRHDREIISRHTREEGVEAARRILSRPREDWPTALIASDELLIGCLEVIRDRGLDIPRELSAVAINDLEQPPFPCPRLAAIRVNYRREGELAGGELLRMLDDPEALGREITLPVEWIERESIGPPRR